MFMTIFTLLGSLWRILPGKTMQHNHWGAGVHGPNEYFARLAKHDIAGRIKRSQTEVKICPWIPTGESKTVKIGLKTNSENSKSEFSTLLKNEKTIRRNQYANQPWQSIFFIMFVECLRTDNLGDATDERISFVRWKCLLRTKGCFGVPKWWLFALGDDLIVVILFAESAN